MKNDSAFFRVIVPIFLICIIVATLFALDNSRGVYNDKNNTLLCVTVINLDGRPVENATVTIVETGQKFVTDKQGKTLLIPLSRNAVAQYEWFHVTLTIKAENYVDTILIDCAIYDDMTRYVTVKIYPMDGTLPYVVYTESPPDDYIRKILEK